MCQRPNVPVPSTIVVVVVAAAVAAARTAMMTTEETIVVQNWCNDHNDDDRIRFVVMGVFVPMLASCLVVAMMLDSMI